MSNWPLARASISYGEVTANVGPSGTANTKSAWVQLVAAAPPGVQGIVLRWGPPSTEYPDLVAVDIGIGGAGSEVVVAHDLMMLDQPYGSARPSWIIPLSLPAGQRVALRAQSAGTQTATVPYIVEFIRGTGLWPISGSKVLAHGFNASTTLGTTLQLGGYGYGTAVEMVASLPRRALGFGIGMVDQGNNDFGGRYSAARLRLGASGPLIGPSVSFQSSRNVWTLASAVQFFPAAIPAGSALYLEAYNSDGWTPQRGFVLYTVH